MSTAAIIIIIRRPPNAPVNAPFDPLTDTIERFGSCEEPLTLKDAMSVLQAEENPVDPTPD